MMEKDIKDTRDETVMANQPKNPTPTLPKGEGERNPKDPYSRTSFENMREMIASIATTSNKKGVIVGLVESNGRRIAKARKEIRALKFEQHYYRNELRKLEAKDVEDCKDGN